MLYTNVSYPPSMMSKWTALKEREDHDQIYADSISQLKALSLILQRSIKSLMNVERIGYFIHIIQNIFNILQNNYEMQLRILIFTIFKPAIKAFVEVNLKFSFRNNLE